MDARCLSCKHVGKIDPDLPGTPTCSKCRSRLYGLTFRNPNDPVARPTEISPPAATILLPPAPLVDIAAALAAGRYP